MKSYASICLHIRRISWIDKYRIIAYVVFTPKQSVNLRWRTLHPRRRTIMPNDLEATCTLDSHVPSDKVASNSPRKSTKIKHFWVKYWTRDRTLLTLVIWEYDMCSNIALSSGRFAGTKADTIMLNLLLNREMGVSLVFTFLCFYLRQKQRLKHSFWLCFYLLATREELLSTPENPLSSACKGHVTR